MFDNEIIDIDLLINKDYRFEAHKGETIKEHTDKSVFFFKRIWNEKKLDKVLIEIEKKLLRGYSERSIGLFEDLLIHTIVFHDIGKINPRFQYIRLKREEFEKEYGSDTLGTKHSIISAIIYLQYFMPKIQELPSKEHLNMLKILFLNSYIISRHHTRLEEYKNYLDSFYKGDGEIYIKEVFEKMQKYVNPHIKLFVVDLIPNISKKISSVLVDDKIDNICFYTYERLLFSLLVASDYYATTLQNEGYLVQEYGTIKEMENLYNIYQNTARMKKIRESKSKNVCECIEINEVRTCLFLEAEHTLMQNLNKNIFYLEAPTGSGKSNIAFNLSFQLVKNSLECKKIMYIYPFNTLVEQNEKILNKIFENDKNIWNQVKVVNSITPILPQKADEENESYNQWCQKALLDRQFFNYPIAISTHVTLFDIMFSMNRETIFSFHQLANSVIVLDEIQSYRNAIWTEIITFLKVFAEILNIKIIIMSATLPNLDLLSKEQSEAVILIPNSELYFQKDCFRNRISDIDYSLLNIEREQIFEKLAEKISYHVNNKEKILVEFITKSAAEKFYGFMKEKVKCKVLCLTGDDNYVDRYYILQEVEMARSDESIILISTQVIEAGVDIENIQVGFKNISRLDLEEQFMGRINRSNQGNGKVYFFEYDTLDIVYRNDMRNGISLHDTNGRKMVENKKFSEFYKYVFKNINELNDSLRQDECLQEFWKEVGELNQKKIAQRMKLIYEDKGVCNIFFARQIKLPDESVLDGSKIWERYEKILLQRESMPYSNYKVELSRLISQMKCFIYRIRIKNRDFEYNSVIGELYYIENGEDYFVDGKINKDKLENGIGVFI